MNKYKTRYKELTELNGDCPSTGSILCYDGNTEYDDGPFQNQFIEVQDCHNKIRLHRSCFDSEFDWLCKVSKMIQALQRYHDHLLKNYDEISPLVTKEGTK